MAQFKNQKRILHNGPIGDLPIVERPLDQPGDEVEGLLFRPGDFMNAQTQILMVSCTARLREDRASDDELQYIHVKVRIDDRDLRVKADGTAYHNNIVPSTEEKGPIVGLHMCVDKKSAGVRVAMPAVAIPVYLDGRDYHGHQRDFRLTLEPSDNCAIDQHDILNVTIDDHG